MKVTLFIPCFVDLMFPKVGISMVEILERLGHQVDCPENIACCGQPAFNAGFWEDAKQVASKFIKDFEGTDYIVAPSASCVGFVRNYYNTLFENSSLHNNVKDLSKRIYEFTEFLTDVLRIDNYGAVLDAKATYHDSCAALRECKIKEGPRKLLGKVKGLELIEMADNETCCGFGGSFAVKFESISIAMADQKVNHALNTGAEYIISTDLSCLMHLDGYITKKELPIKTMHIADVLASGWE